MGFDTLPKIDLNSERSEDSVIKTRNAFMRKYGFISREVDGSQDYGVDIYSEIIDNGEATGVIFPIQVKSGKRAQIIHKKDGQYISLKFKNSRFGYLCKQLPYYGIIVFYDENNDILYYDYVRDLYERLVLEKPDDAWKGLEYIMLHIPINNILDSHSVEKIRKSFLIIHKNHLNLIQHKGTEYGVYPINIITNRSLGKSGIIQRLEKEGINLINNFQYAEIINLLGELPSKYIYSNSKLLFLAVLSNAEMGYLLDAALFRSKYFNLRSEKRLSSNFEEILIIYEFVIEHGLGRYNRAETIKKLLDIEDKIINPDNLSALESHISMLKVEGTLGNTIYDIDDVEDVVKVIDSIERRATSQSQKIIQKVIQTEILVHSISRLYGDYLTDSYLYINMPEPPEREIRKKYIDDKYNLIFDINIEALKYNETIHNRKLEAIAKHNLAKYYYLYYSTQYINRLSPYNIKEIELSLEKGIRFALDSWVIYQKMSMFRDAYIAIREAYELYRLGEEYLNRKLETHTTLVKIKKILNSYSNMDFYSNHISTIDMYCSQIKNNKINSLSVISPEDLDNVAPKLLHSLNLPNERLENMKKDYRNYFDFNSHCDSKDLELLSNLKSLNIDEFWKNPVQYKIRNNKTGKIYIEGNDVIRMLKQIGHYKE